MKKRKKYKNKHPELYGYGSKEELITDQKRITGNNEKQIYWLSFIDYDGDLRFVSCTKEEFYNHRNENRNEQKRDNAYRKRCPISIDYMYEKYGFEYADPSYEEDKENEVKQEQLDRLHGLVSELNETDQLILQLFSEKHTDQEIGKKLNRARSTIQERRSKLFKLLREKMEKFK